MKKTTRRMYSLFYCSSIAEGLPRSELWLSLLQQECHEEMLGFVAIRHRLPTYECFLDGVEPFQDFNAVPSLRAVIIGSLPMLIHFNKGFGDVE